MLQDKIGSLKDMYARFHEMLLMGKEEYACLQINQLNKANDSLRDNPNYSRILNQIELNGRLLLCVQKQVTESQDVLNKVEQEHTALCAQYSSAQYADNNSFHIA